ncbi:MAG: M28 family peptidase [Bacteroidales bacterium]|nr:M28 family peptidase [Bacteroidales bacterium]MCL2738970.1 M28 family peptidase [Bacteroidales bacterium]
MPRFSFVVSVLLLFFSSGLYGQLTQADRNLNIISQEQLRKHVRALADTAAQGRASGTVGALIAAQYIRDCFRSYGLQPFNGSSWVQSFAIDSSTYGRNLIAMLRGNGRSDEYLIISAHYDHIGMINNVVYPGADDNASGVALLLQLAQVFGQRARNGDRPARTILFVAYDAKELNLAGSAHFAQSLRIPPYKIIANINIDQIGCVLEPPRRNPEYLLVLGAERLTPDLKLIIDISNRYYGIGLDLDYTYYDSPNFSELFFRFGDQIHLAQKGIPSVLFTSGIHAYTYKATDLPALLHYPVLEKRTKLIYLVVNDLASRRSWLRRY